MGAGTPPLDDSEPMAMVRRLEAATNAHDLDALADCFSSSYRNETPIHPARGFTGRDQVRRNWQTILAGVPDLRAEVIRAAVSGDVVWTEWEMSGRRRDGSPHLMRGVVIFMVAGGRATGARFYLEPVDPTAADVDSAVRADVGLTS